MHDRFLCAHGLEKEVIIFLYQNAFTVASLNFFCLLATAEYYDTDTCESLRREERRIILKFMNLLLIKLMLRIKASVKWGIIPSTCFKVSIRFIFETFFTLKKTLKCFQWQAKREIIKREISCEILFFWDFSELFV